MKKAFLLLSIGALFLAACQEKPDLPGSGEPQTDEALTGEKLDVSFLFKTSGKIFVLNEGQMGSNNASLDFLRLTDGTYVTGAFKKMNPKAGAGLGDVGNDIVIHGDEAWIVVNNSGIVEVISAKDEKEIAAITIPTPRFIAFDGDFAYISSYAGAYVTYDSNYTVTASDNPKGAVYKVDAKTKKVLGSVEVGYQPEGIAVYNGKLYVANSGGISSRVGPYYAYDCTVSVIDIASFQVTATIEIAINPQRVYSDGKGNIYVNSFGDFYSVHSSLWRIDTKNGNKVEAIADYATYTAACGETIYCIGNENEFDYTQAKKWNCWTCRDGVKSDLNLNLDGISPYSIGVIGPAEILIGDAGDYFNPGSVSLFFEGTRKWTVTAGVCPGHFAIY